MNPPAEIKNNPVDYISIGMTVDSRFIKDREIRIREGRKDLCVITFFADFDEEFLPELIGSIPEVTVAAVRIDDWNREMSPWKAPPVFGNEPFGDGAGEMLDFITDVLIPELGCERYVIGGYSLSALFSLWACYRTDSFCGCAAASPSVWFPEWDSFIANNSIRTGLVYLSLGDKEAKTRNQVMATVADRIRLQYNLLSEQIGSDKVLLEWNAGNHFKDVTKRCARSFEWVLGNL